MEGREKKKWLWQCDCRNRKREKKKKNCGNNIAEIEGEKKKMNCSNGIAKIEEERSEKKNELWLGQSMGWAGSGLCPTWTRLDIIRWGRFQPATNLNEVSNQLGRVVLVFGCVSVGFGFSNIAEFWLKFGRISSNLARSDKIWPS